MDGFEGNSGIIILAATNRPDVLDSALMRPGRFDRQVTVDAPDIKGRLSILEVHSRNKKLDDQLTLDSIARRTPGFTGADLANLLNEAAILTARRRKESIGISEIDDAVDRIIAGMEGHPLTDGRSKRLIAYHEVGHALVGTLVKDHDPVQKVTLIPRGQAQGLTWFSPDEEQMLVSRSQLKARIMGALGGRAAEDVVFGHSEITTGAGGDIQMVASLARQMVTKFGMSQLGPMALEGGNQEVFLGRDLMTRSDVSDAISKQIDEQVRLIVMKCYEETVELVGQHRQAMDKLVEQLIEQETLDGDEFRVVVGEFAEIPEKERFSPLLA
jgi:cell division protease FtsH